MKPRLGCSICRNKALSRCLMAEGSRDKWCRQRRAERAARRLKDEQMRIPTALLLRLVQLQMDGAPPGSDAAVSCAPESRPDSRPSVVHVFRPDPHGEVRSDVQEMIWRQRLEYLQRQAAGRP